MTQTATVVPPLIRAARFVASRHQAMSVDNVTGAIVHSKWVEQALIETGIDPLWTEQDDVDGKHEQPILIRRKRSTLCPILLDALTASMLAQLWDKLNANSRARIPELIQRWGCQGFIERMWKLAR